MSINYTPANVTSTERTREFRDFGLIDNRGRKIGTIITRWTETYTPRGDGKSGLVVRPEWIGTTRYWVEPGASRDEESFGAIAKNSSFATAEERDAYAEKSAAASFKRFSKKFPKQA